MSKWIWLPRKKIGIFEFDKYLNLDDTDYIFHKVDSYDSHEVYDLIGEGARISLDEGYLAFVECYSSIFFNNLNLIGLTKEEIVNIFSDSIYSEAFHSDDFKWIEVNYDELGATFWLENGKVESVTVSS